MWNENRLLNNGNYRVIQQINRGKYGLVYIAVDCISQEQVIIKKPRISKKSVNYEEIVSQFKKEKEVLDSVSSTSIVNLINTFEEEECLCLVLSYIRGKTLQERIEERGHISQENAIIAFRKLACGLQKLHNAGFVHCDIHPKNIILRSDTDPVLVDLGSAQPLQGENIIIEMTRNPYVPYEQKYKGSKPKASMDVYALSAVLYFAVAGKAPPDAEVMERFGYKLPPPTRFNSAISMWLESAILQGMKLDAAYRPASMDRLLIELQEPEPIETKLLKVIDVRLSHLPLHRIFILMMTYIPIGALASADASGTMNNGFLLVILAFSAAFSWTNQVMGCLFMIGAVLGLGGLIWLPFAMMWNGLWAGALSLFFASLVAGLYAILGDELLETPLTLSVVFLSWAWVWSILWGQMALMIGTNPGDYTYTLIFYVLASSILVFPGAFGFIDQIHGTFRIVYEKQQIKKEPKSSYVSKKKIPTIFYSNSEDERFESAKDKWSLAGHGLIGATLASLGLGKDTIGWPGFWVGLLVYGLGILLVSVIISTRRNMNYISATAVFLILSGTSILGLFIGKLLNETFTSLLALP